MKTMQRGGPSAGAHRCIVVYGLVFLALLLPVGSDGAPAKSRDVHDYATVYVDQFFEPDPRLLLSEEGKKKSRALAHYFLGRSLEAKGRTMDAVKAYRTVLENQPGQHFLARKTAYLLARNGSNDEALKMLEGNLEKNPDEPFAYISLSEYLATYQANDEKGRDRAFAVVEEAVEKFPGEPAVYDHLVRLYIINNLKDDARALIEKASTQSNADPEFWLALGGIAAKVWPPRNDGDSEEADLVNGLYGKALSFAGEDKAVVEQVADYYHATRQFDRAITAYTEVIQDSPDRLEVREKLARVYGAKGDEEKVIQTLKEIVEIDLQSARTHKQLAQIYMRKQQFVDAIPHLRKALAITKGSATEYNALARMMIENEQHEAAVEFLTDAAYLFPEIPDFPFLLTFSLGRLERWDDSVEQFEKTIELAGEENPQMLNEAFYFRYAAATERGGNIKDAEKLFRKSMELIAQNDPNDENKEFTATVYNYLGYMWLENDMNIDEAGELIKTASELDPDSGAIVDSLGWFHFKKGRYDEALKALLRAEEMITQEDAVIYDHIGQAYFMNGNREKAIEYMKKAVELDPEKEEFANRLKEYQASEDKPKEKPAKESPESGDQPPKPPKPPKPAEEGDDAKEAA